MSDDYDFKTWPMHGRLLNGVVVPCTYLEWAVNFEKTYRIGSDMIEGAHVSTVFIGLNHGYGGRPLWFETMVFGLVMHDKSAQLQERYETLAEAKAGHERHCAWVREHIEVMRAERREALIAEEASTPASPPPPAP